MPRIKDSRRTERKGLDVDERSTLLEGDVDDLEEMIDKVSRKIDRIVWAIFTLLISLVASVVTVTIQQRTGG
jgi:hypothetical protein|tara:strand:- start:298 stop:513 length:216 start_codon:yes stop_codon:yes gene_type:complete